MQSPIRRVEKPWGYELIFAHTDRYVGKILHVNAGQALSLQYHEIKDETLYLSEGEVELVVEEDGDMVTTGPARRRFVPHHAVHEASDGRGRERLRHHRGLHPGARTTWSGWKIAMAGPRPLACGALLWALLAAAGCAGAPPAPKAKAQEPPPPAAQPDTTPEAEPAPTPAPEAAAPNEKPEGVEVVVDPGGEKAPVSLAEAGRAETERRARSGHPVAVITDKTLAKIRQGADHRRRPEERSRRRPRRRRRRYRTRPSRSTTSNTGAAAAGRSARAGSVRPKRSRSWRQSAAGLRRRFYAEDDPYVRDTRVKPEWDRVLDRLDEARDEVEAAKKELADFWRRQAAGTGALPGWLREGAELEPEGREEEDGARRQHQPIEPPVYVPSEPPPMR